MVNMTYVWLGAVLLFLVLEGATAAVTSLWFVVGALAALLVAVLDGALWLQITVFCVVSVALLLALRPWLKKFINPKKVKTNVDAIVGRQGLVLEDIDNLTGTGKVKLDGMEWTARSANGEKIEKDTVVVVEKIEGVKVFVKMQNAECTMQN